MGLALTTTLARAGRVVVQVSGRGEDELQHPGPAPPRLIQPWERGAAAAAVGGVVPALPARSPQGWVALPEGEEDDEEEEEGGPQRLGYETLRDGRPCVGALLYLSGLWQRLAPFHEVGGWVE